MDSSYTAVELLEVCPVFPTANMGYLQDKLRFLCKISQLSDVVAILSTGAAFTAILAKALATCGLELLERHYDWEDLTHTTKHSKKLAHKEPCLTQASAAAAVAVITVASSQVKTRSNHVRCHGIFLQIRPEK